MSEYKPVRQSYLIRLISFLPAFFLLWQASAQIWPHKAYPELFHEVQMQQVFEDSKTFPDCVPVHAPEKIRELYISKDKNQNLREFVLANFLLPPEYDQSYRTGKDHSIEEHINALWPVLTRNPDTITRSSLIPLPKSYIVPGGRFREVYYWDSWFTMLGLKESGKKEMIRNMCDNFASLIDRYGFIPNGNRTYYLSRSQPPFFSLMVKLLAETDGDSVYVRYLPALEKEYLFWMKGKEDARPGQPGERVVALGPRTYLNRYWDSDPSPRPESYREDVLLAEKFHDDSALYRNLRAACESGWDFSSRWLRDPGALESIHTTDILPVDLNCLLYHLELALSRGASLSGNAGKAGMYKNLAEERKRNIHRYFWNSEKQFFHDYDFIKRKNTPVISAAAMFPLFFSIADSAQASALAGMVRKGLFHSGGISATVIRSGQQWDAPNGWPPLQYITVKGLENYGYGELAMDISRRWLTLNRKVFLETGKMMEKYNVMNPTVKAGGGEYPTQDGFGWTNGVYLILEKSYIPRPVQRERKPIRR